ncbi:MAG: hypothetical protein V3U75_04285 [Methylococcaceae bacterium]
MEPLKVGDKVSVVIAKVVCPGVAKGIEEGICDIAFDDGDEGSYPVDEVTIIQDETPEAPPAKGKEQIEKEADGARKKKVDADNKKTAEKAKAEEDALAETPLTGEERAFIAEIDPKMNEGRKIAQPSPAEILRYSRLIKRKDVK